MTTKKGLLEGILFASPQPVSESTLCELLEVASEDLKELIGELQEKYSQADHGFSLVLVGGGYQLRTKAELKEVMAKFYEKKPPRLSQAMLEVLSIVAYKQPVTRPEIDKIRGVDSSAPLKSLLERELIEMKARSEAMGNPVLYATTSRFLEWFQISSLENLPPLSEIEALDVASEGTEDPQLLEALNRDSGFQQEDLAEVDQELQHLSKEQKKAVNQLEEANSQSSEEAQS